jgi:hypothetical protein
MSVAARGWGKLPGSAGKDGRRSQEVCPDPFDAAFREDPANCQFALPCSEDDI